MFFSYSSLPTTLVLLSSRFQFFHLFFFFFPVSCCCSSSQNFSFCWSPRKTGQIQHRTKFLPCVGRFKISVFLLSSIFVFCFCFFWGSFHFGFLVQFVCFCCCWLFKMQTQIGSWMLNHWIWTPFLLLECTLACLIPNEFWWDTRWRKNKQGKGSQ